MAFRSMMVAALCTLSITGVALTGGCQTPKEKAENKAFRSIKDFRKELSTMNPQIDKVMNSLRDTVDGANTNPSASLKTFNSELSDLRRNARTIADESDHVSGNLDSYFTQFNREIGAERDATQRAAAQGTEATQRLNYQDYADTLKAGKQDYMQLVGNLTDIQNKFAGGVNADSLKSVNALYSRATDNSIATKNSVSRVMEAIDKAIAGRK